MRWPARGTSFFGAQSKTNESVQPDYSFNRVSVVESNDQVGMHCLEHTLPVAASLEVEICVAEKRVSRCAAPAPVREI